MADTTTTSAPVKTASSPLMTEKGKTTIADSVVTKIAGIAAREVSGVHAMGSGASRAIGALRDRLPGNTTNKAVGQGVNVEVGERQAAVDIDIVAEYGVPLVDLSNSVRQNVTSRIERMTGLEVTEVNITVDDIYLEDESEQPSPTPERVQ